jgi:hypothetical protein
MSYELNANETKKKLNCKDNKNSVEIKNFSKAGLIVQQN